MDVPVKQEAKRGEVEHASDKPVYVPGVDIYESEEAVTILADLPGVPKEGVNLTLEKGILTLWGNEEMNPPEGSQARYLETRPGNFYRSFRLGPEVEEGKMEARMEDGVLHIRVPKSDFSKTRKIEVK